MLDIIKLQKIIVKAFVDYELSSPRLDKEVVGAFLAVDIYRAEVEPVPAPTRGSVNPKKQSTIPNLIPEDKTIEPQHPGGHRSS